MSEANLDRRPAIDLTSKGWNREHVTACPAGRLCDRVAQDGVRSQLDKYQVTVPLEAVDDRTEQHGLAQVADPVLACHLRTVNQGIGHGRVHRDVHRLGANRRQGFEQPIAQWIDVRTMGRDVDADFAAKDSFELELFGERANRGRRAGHDNACGAVDRRQRECRIRCQARARLLSRQLDDGHRTRSADLAKQCAPSANDGSRVLTRQRTGDARSRHLAEAVSDDGVGLHPVGSPQVRERDGDRKQRRLDHVDPAGQIGRPNYILETP